MPAPPARFAEPPRDCALCPRLAAFRAANRKAHSGFFNAPVPAFGPLDARVLIVGLAPGLKGANRTGRPFTGDYAGDLLYATLPKFGFARGIYDRRIDDGFALVDCRITNAVRCVPPENKPTPAEARTCRESFLAAEIAAMPKLAAIVALGQLAHNEVLKALGERRAAFPFRHGALHRLAKLALADSYHCSRYNTNTGVLTPAMFESVFAALAARLGRSD
ncbi:MAG: uracil-DNA glycosylase [Candidatus Odyssella sp.]|nr:uracil-DNA glycosylase [Candidatus Odyssella sp.]